MNPGSIAEQFNKGNLTTNEATFLFVLCVREIGVDEIVKYVPERLGFKEFITSCPDRDIPIIGLGVPVLKKEWIEKFKSFYEKSRDV
jgi:hypothetical protein